MELNGLLEVFPRKGLLDLGGRLGMYRCVLGNVFFVVFVRLVF